MAQFVVFGETSRPVESGEGALDDPWFGQHAEQFLLVAFTTLTLYSNVSLAQANSAPKSAYWAAQHSFGAAKSNTTFDRFLQEFSLQPLDSVHPSLKIRYSVRYSGLP